jgi:hypothetical protein
LPVRRTLGSIVRSNKDKFLSFFRNPGYGRAKESASELTKPQISPLRFGRDDKFAKRSGIEVATKLSSRPERSGVERSAVLPFGPMFFDKATPDFLPRCTRHIHLCAFPLRKAHELHQRHQTPQEIRGSGVERFAVSLSSHADSSARTRAFCFSSRSVLRKSQGNGLIDWTL